MKRLAAAFVPVALLVSSCAVGQVDSIDDVGPLGAGCPRHGLATSDPASLELLLVAKAGGTPTPDDNDIVSPTNQNAWSRTAAGCLTVTPAAGSSHVYVPNANFDTLSQYDIGTGGALTPKTPESVGTGLAPPEGWLSALTAARST